MQIPESPFKKRGIPQEIADARPYVRWTPDDNDAVKALFASLPQPGQRAFISKVVSPRWTPKRDADWQPTSGYAITRHAPPLLTTVEDIYPELRPDEAVETDRPTVHWHGDGIQPPFYGKTLPATMRKADGEVVPHSHITGKRHKGVNTEEVHSHANEGKYVFPPAPKMDVEYTHTHDTMAQDTAKHLGHLRKQHGGLQVEGPHSHTKRVKVRHTHYADRIDVHPDAVGLLVSEGVVYFVIEGCLKADAILAAGGAVFSVPSVTMWPAPELSAFINQYLTEKTVIIVPDADWVSNPLVINQARLCQTFLLRSGVPVVHVAAPPLTHNGVPTKGVDDFLGPDSGGQLADLLVVNSTPPTSRIESFVRDRTVRGRGRWEEGYLRNVGALYNLSAYSGASGVFKSAVSTMAKVIGERERTLQRAVEALEAMGAVTIEGDTETRRGWFTRREEWQSQPTITLAKGLRAIEDAPYPLGLTVAIEGR